jgi:hypothetical protein
VQAATDHTAVRVTRTGGPPVGVTVAPALPSGRDAGEARADEAPIVPRVSEREGCRHAAVTLEASGTHDVEVWYR